MLLNLRQHKAKTLLSWMIHRRHVCLGLIHPEWRLTLNAKTAACLFNIQSQIDWWCTYMLTVIRWLCKLHMLMFSLLVWSKCTKSCTMSVAAVEMYPVNVVVRLMNLNLNANYIHQRQWQLNNNDNNNNRENSHWANCILYVCYNTTLNILVDCILYTTQLLCRSHLGRGLEIFSKCLHSSVDWR